MDGPGIPGWFIGLFVLAIAGGIITTVVRVSMARNMAQKAGLDPGQAAAATLLTNNGLDATYLAASLRGNVPPAHASSGTAEARLRELQDLHDKGLVDDAELAARRRAILDEV